MSKCALAIALGKGVSGGYPLHPRQESAEMQTNV
jgi:hypothetical protein